MKNPVKNYYGRIQTLLTLGFFALGSANAAIVIDTLTWTDGSQTVTSGPFTPTTMTDDTTMLEFTTGTDIYSQFVYANSVSALTGNTFYGDPDGTNPGSASAALTDNRLDSGITAMADGANFFFPSVPTTLDQVMFAYEIGGPEDTTWQLFDGTNALIGSPAVIASGTWTQVARVAAQGGGLPVGWSGPIKGLTFGFDSDFGLTLGDLSNVAGVRVTTSNGLDPVLVGFTANAGQRRIPEPGTLGLGLIGGGLLSYTRSLRRKRNNPDN